MDDLAVRPPNDDELATLAEFRWQWDLENGRTPTINHDEFVHSFVLWAQRNRRSHRAVVMLRGSEIIGMAWLAIVPRVPTPRSVERSSGDVQSVYVVPHERDRGHGGRLIEAIMRLAREAGVERVTVHSSDRAVPMYERQRFVNSPRLLQAEVPPSSGRIAG
ncbi:GNAT family N-acetyltransferase [Haloechinothrix sp. LS1_15]|uniref:GNAT family N-acetyltransferase n=1 Tax=Haloechinothrix sp. LS1_15 TaxID=2652248 RepID=UPI002945998F|nr:GNAT family N-acetyltransferase [Haloechinothrix sp. LS1_15]MDV6011114.1 GNAT family N-acetyltransferase [Haloechinothrix sp. LS1_15]